jgi:hypothetical protein
MMMDQDNERIVKEHSAELREFERFERSTAMSIRRVIRLQDLMALLMVIATAFTGFATWEYVQVTRAIFRSSQRPYVGIGQIRIDQTDSSHPHLVVEYRDFSEIPADHSQVIGRLLIDGAPPRGQRETLSELGVLSPQVPRFFHKAIPTASLHPILEGKSNLSLEIEFSYRDATDRAYCYRMKFEYHPAVSDFVPSGGSDRCSLAGL